MFGKYFASTFTGSMFGAGPHVFAVWGYVIANAEFGRVELNPRLVSSVLGAPIDDVEAAIAFLTQPDPHSRNKAEDGRRLVQEGQFQYRVTSHNIYRSMRNEDDRRAYNRKKQQESRARRKQSLPVNTSVIDSQQMLPASAHTETETETETEIAGSENLATHKIETTRAQAAPRKFSSPHSKSTNLINAAEIRGHGSHAWCSMSAGREGFCVPAFLHKQFMGKGHKSEKQMLAWYPTVIAAVKGTPVGEDGLVFWRAKFAAWIGNSSARRGSAVPDAGETLAYIRGERA